MDLSTNIIFTVIQTWLLTEHAYSVPLSTLYAIDSTFTVSSSPYTVENDVVISDGITITVENGVEIIFMADYAIYVRGTFNFCNNIDTSGNKNRGLADSTTYGYIHSDSSLIRNGSIAFESGTNGHATFCNVLFENLNIAINTDSGGLASPYIATVDNCEFRDLNRAFDGKDFHGDTSIFNDSYFHNINEVVFDSAAIFDNNLFENFGSVLSQNSFFTGSYFTFTNNVINGDGTQQCLEISNSIFEYNIIDNCDTAITTDSYYNSIRHNTFSNHNTAIKMVDKSNDDRDEINYNNFINNIVTLNNTGNTDEPNCNYNYFGTSNTDQSVIAASIIDICDSASLGLVTFWPWYISAISIESNTLPIAYSFDFTGCASINNAVSYQLTTNPTSNPTSMPTFIPTSNPTFNPIFNPTSYPTHIPTSLPTDVLTTIITTEPNCDDTGDDQCDNSQNICLECPDDGECDIDEYKVEVFIEFEICNIGVYRNKRDALYDSTRNCVSETLKSNGFNIIDIKIKGFSLHNNNNNGRKKVSFELEFCGKKEDLLDAYMYINSANTNTEFITESSECYEATAALVDSEGFVCIENDKVEVEITDSEGNCVVCDGNNAYVFLVGYAIMFSVIIFVMCLM